MSSEDFRAVMASDTEEEEAERERSGGLPRQRSETS